MDQSRGRRSSRGSACTNLQQPSTPLTSISFSLPLYSYFDNNGSSLAIKLVSVQRDQSHRDAQQHSVHLSKREALASRPAIHRRRTRHPGSRSAAPGRRGWRPRLYGRNPLHSPAPLRQKRRCVRNGGLGGSVRWSNGPSALVAIVQPAPAPPWSQDALQRRATVPRRRRSHRTHARPGSSGGLVTVRGTACVWAGNPRSRLSSPGQVRSGRERLRG